MYKWNEVLQGVGIDIATTPANFVMLTTRMNMWFGTDATSPENELEVWFEKKDRLNYLDCAFKLGFDYVHNTLFSVAANENVLTALQAL